MIKYFVSTGLLLLACACAGTGGGSPYTETSAICDNAGLESQLVSLRDKSNSTQLALGLGTGDGAGAGGFSRENADLERAYQLRDRLNRFNAEVDVQYRTLTSSCKAYSRCMEMRKYRELECSSSLNRWEEAERHFSNLTRDLRKIDAEVEKYRIKASSRRREHNGDKPRPTLNPKDDCKCTDSVGGVFSTCCDSGRKKKH